MNEHKPHHRLTERQKREAIAWVAQGETKASVAKRLNCHVNTVSRLCTGVEGLPNKRISASLESYREKLDVKSYDAVEASLDDREDVHKAAVTGLTWLKGVGVLQGDNQVNVTVQALIAAVPADWQEEMILTPAPGTPPYIEDGCTKDGA